MGIRLPSSRHRWVLPGVLLSLWLGTPALAAWDPAGTPIATGPGAKFRPVIAADEAGGAYIAWYGGPAGAVYMQHVDGQGNALWAPNGQRVCTNLNPESNPRVVADGAGGVVAVWLDSRVSTENRIYAQRLAPDGTLLWPADGVALRVGSGFVRPPEICTDGTGGAIVTWAEFPSLACPDTCLDIRAQRVTGAGICRWAPANGAPVCTAPGSQDAPVIVTDEVGGAVIAWCDRRGADADIYAQRVDSLGVVTWAANGIPVCTAGGDQDNLAAADIGDGTVLAWDDHRTGSPQPYGQGLDLAGSPLVASNGVPIAPAPSESAKPLTVEDAVIFAYAGAPSVQKIDSAGSWLWGPGVDVCTVCLGCEYPVIVPDQSGGAVVVWGDCAVPGVSNARAQRLDGSGGLMWAADGVVLAPSATAEDFIVAVSDGSGGAIAAWQDYRNGGFDVYAQRVMGNGVVGPTSGVASGPAVGLRVDPPRPNPIRDRTTLVFSLPAEARVSADILDVAGRLIRHLLRVGGLGPGLHSVEWDGLDDHGAPAPDGVYLARVTAGGSETRFRITRIR